MTFPQQSYLQRNRPLRNFHDILGSRGPIGNQSAVNGRFLSADGVCSPHRPCQQNAKPCETLFFNPNMTTP
jgi:hypothetical protein